MWVGLTIPHMVGDVALQLPFTLAFDVGRAYNPDATILTPPAFLAFTLAFDVGRAYNRMG